MNTKDLQAALCKLKALSDRQMTGLVDHLQNHENMRYHLVDVGWRLTRFDDALADDPSPDTVERGWATIDTTAFRGTVLLLASMGLGMVADAWAERALAARDKEANQ